MTETNDPMSGMEEQKPQYNNIKFGKVGDWFRGTLSDNTKQMKNNLSERGEMQTIFEFEGIAGSFHDIESRVVAEKPTTVDKGDRWSFITGKPALLNQLKGAKIGQIVGLKFAEIAKAKTKGYNDAKIIKVYLGEMDQEFQGGEF